MAKKPDVIRRLMGEMRKNGAPSIDGSYVLLAKAPSQVYAAASHPAYTPEQIEAERKAIGMGLAKAVYFIRDTEQTAPYWISPVRSRFGKDGTSLVFDVARSRDSRKSDFCEVVIAAADLRGIKNQQDRAKLILRILREAVAGVMHPESRAA